MKYTSVTFFTDLYKFRKMIFKLARRDLSHRFLNSYLGIIWGCLLPLITVGVLWFVFIFGFKVSDSVDGIPFVLWVTAAQVPWSFLIDGTINGTQSITSYEYLVKKIVFKVHALPLIRIFSCLFVHVVLVIVMMIVFVSYGYISLYSFQILYYLFCSIVLLFAISLITASLNVFTRDVFQIVNVLAQVGFWITPVFWKASSLPQKYQLLVKLNPFFYITEGYRYSLLYKVGFWESPYWALEFWVMTLIILLIGVLVYNKTSPYFADVL